MANKIIIIGTTSPIKINAVKEVFPDYRVSGLSCDSSVHEQPVGLEETEKGAKYRATCAFNSQKEKPCYAIGIENGMVKMGTDWYDFAAIVIIDPSGREVTIWSDKIKIPQDAIKNCMDISGQVTKNWSPLKDPHLGISGKPRQKFLSEALKKWKHKRVWGL